jgi:hypothetical protein
VVYVLQWDLSGMLAHAMMDLLAEVLLMKLKRGKY